MNALDPQADIALTPKGEAYAVAHLRPMGCPAGVDPATWRRAVEARAEALLDMATTLLAMLDQMDGDAEAEIDTDDEAVDEDGGDMNDTHGDDLDVGELDTADFEYSLGWGIPTETTSQGLGYMCQGKGDQEDTTEYGVDQRRSGVALCDINPPDLRHDVPKAQVFRVSPVWTDRNHNPCVPSSNLGFATKYTL